MRSSVPLRRYALVLLAGSMGFVLLLWTLWISGLIGTRAHEDPNGNPPGIDYAIFHTAGRILQDGDESDLYEASEFRAALAVTIGEDDEHPTSLFVNPPVFAALFMPVADLPYRIGLAMWSGIGIGALVTGIWLLGMRKLGFAVAAALLFYPVFVGFRLGQNSFISFMLFAASFYMLRKGNQVWAGVALGMLVFKPQLALGVALWWTLDWRRYRRAWNTAAATALSVLAVGWLMWPDATNAYFTGLSELVGVREPEFLRSTFSPQAFFVLLLPGQEALATGLAVAAAGVGIIWFWSYWKGHRDDLEGLFALAVIVSLWISPRVVVYDWTLLLIPAIILAAHRKDLEDTWLMLAGLFAIVAAFSIPLATSQLDSLGWAVQIAVPTLALGAMGVSRALSIKPGPS